MYQNRPNNPNVKNALFSKDVQRFATLCTERMFQDAMLDFPNVEINSVLKNQNQKISVTSNIDGIVAGTRQMIENQFLEKE
jgi:hypothetical protein